MKNIIALTALATTLTFSSVAMAQSIGDIALSYIPGGKILEVKRDEVKVLTPNSTVVEVEFKRDGSFEEASGDVIEKDIFVPGQGMLSLADAVTEFQKSGDTATGDWSLDHGLVHGWHYEFEGYKNGQQMEYTVDAITGKILDSRVDN